MLKDLNPLLNPDILYALRAMGHGDDLIVADTNFPAHRLAAQTTLGEVLRIDRPAAEAMAAVLSVFPIDTFEPAAAARMEVVGEPDTLLPVMEEVQQEIHVVGGPDLVGLERFAFYDRAKSAFAILQTDERRFYGCFALCKGVVPPEET